MDRFVAIFYGILSEHPSIFNSGDGKYGVYLANYAAYGENGLVGAHTIFEMDEVNSVGNKIVLKNIGEQAGVKRFTGKISNLNYKRKKYFILFHLYYFT